MWCLAVRRQGTLQCSSAAVYVGARVSVPSEPLVLVLLFEPTVPVSGVEVAGVVFWQMRFPSCVPV